MAQGVTIPGRTSAQRVFDRQSPVQATENATKLAVVALNNLAYLSSSNPNPAIRNDPYHFAWIHGGSETPHPEYEHYAAIRIQPGAKRVDKGTEEQVFKNWGLRFLDVHYEGEGSITIHVVPDSDRPKEAKSPVPVPVALRAITTGPTGNEAIG